MDRMTQKGLRWVLVAVAAAVFPLPALADVIDVNPQYHETRYAYCSACNESAYRYNAVVHSLYATANSVNSLTHSLEINTKSLSGFTKIKF